MTNPIISFKNVSFKYDSQQENTLSDINLDIYEGEIVAIIGASGSGKSTLGNLINGLIPNSIKGDLTGQVLIDGQDLKATNLFELSLKVGTILQDTNRQFIGLTTAEDIAFSLENDETEQTKMHNLVNKWASNLDLTKLLHLSPQKLSGGQKQRTSLAGVLIDDSKVLLFDEPLASLDPYSSTQTMALIHDVHEKLNQTIVLIEHRLEQILSPKINRVVVMDDGKIVFNDSVSNLLKSSILQEVGLRPPSYIELLQKCDVNFDNVDYIDDVTKLISSEIPKKLNNQKPHTKTAPSVDDENQLRIKDLSFYYQKVTPIFNQLNFSISKGEKVSLVGQNGVGKSTLSQLICGFLTPKTGDILLNNENLLKLSIKERADKIGYIMQDPNQMISKVMLKDEIALGLKLRGVNDEEIDRRLTHILKICGLHPFRNWPISALSFGQKKRVTIASMLILNPEILILDEPTAGQDYSHALDILKFIDDINSELGVTIIFITHDMNLMIEHTDRTIVIGNHSILMDAAPIDILKNDAILKQASLQKPTFLQLMERFNIPLSSEIINLFKIEVTK